MRKDECGVEGEGVMYTDSTITLMDIMGGGPSDFARALLAVITKQVDEEIMRLGLVTDDNWTMPARAIGVSFDEVSGALAKIKGADMPAAHGLKSYLQADIRSQYHLHHKQPLWQSLMDWVAEVRTRGGK